MPINQKLSYNRSEKLKSRKLIEQLFSTGKSFAVPSIRVLYDFVEISEVPLQAGVTVSSRYFKKAVHRNRIKRMLREAYRLQKSPLQDALLHQKKSLILFFIYTARELPVFSAVFEKMQTVLQRITNNNLTKHTEN